MGKTPVRDLTLDVFRYVHDHHDTPLAEPRNCVVLLYRLFHVAALFVVSWLCYGVGSCSILQWEA